MASPKVKSEWGEARDEHRWECSQTEEGTAWLTLHYRSHMLAGVELFPEQAKELSSELSKYAEELDD